MKIYLYSDWKETPLNYSSPISTVNCNRLFLLMVDKRTGWSIMHQLRKRIPRPLNKKAKYLVRLVDKDYNNEFIGTPNEVLDYVKTCLSDLGFIKEKLGRGLI